MRILTLFCALIVAGCGTPVTVAQSEPGVETVRVERLGEIYLTAGSDEEDAPYSFSLGYDAASAQLGDLTSVSWSVRFGDYCQNYFTTLTSVVIGPDGQVWRGYRVGVPPGPDRTQDWSSGGDGAEQYGGPATPGLVEAVARGGRFTLALEDGLGERWNAVVIDTLSPPERERLYADYLSTDPAPPDPNEGMLLVVEAPHNTPTRPRPCP